MPKTEADLQAAVDDGLFEESHHLDLKKAPNSKGDNKELARDLSSFAVDGGTLIIGVQENKESRTFELAPHPLNGLPEKIEQVARTIPDPPLTILTEEISSAADDGSGYLVVHVPASPVAPHMVDNRYFGRGDKTKYQMGDAEVFALHARRRNTEADTLALLRKEMDEDLLRDVGAQSHLFLALAKIGRDGREIGMDCRDMLDLVQLDRRTDRILPNGYCLLPPTRSCDKGNACHGCDHFATDRTFLSDIQRQLAETQALVATRQARHAERYGEPMSEANVWLEQRNAEIRSMQREITALEAQPADSSAVVRGAGVLGRTGYQNITNTPDNKGA
ncbi:AlbA family DNA-binding domain-containing protein [Streptomyces sp. NPDC004721]